MFTELDFSSDNSSGVHPQIMEAIVEANNGPAMAYGLDMLTLQALQKLRDVFGEQAEPHLLWSGTAANVLALKAVLQPHHAVLCAERSHIYEDETGAPEAATSCKLIPLPAPHGKISPESIAPHLRTRGDVHRVVPRVLSITQATEFGTVYSVAEIRELAAFAHRHNLLLHLDGARIANAAASLGVSFREMTTEAGVDFLSFGASKNGCMAAEAVIFLRPGLADHFQYLQKQGMQLASKMRFIAAQMLAYLEDDRWLKNAQHANAMAQKLAAAATALPGVTLAHPQQANGVFVQLPKKVATALQRHAGFYEWTPEDRVYRWMCSFNTTEDQINRLVGYLKQAVAVQSAE